MKPVKQKRYIFSADEVTLILAKHIEDTYGFPYNNVDADADWHIKEPAKDNYIIIKLEPRKDDIT